MVRWSVSLPSRPSHPPPCFPDYFFPHISHIRLLCYCLSLHHHNLHFLAPHLLAVKPCWHVPPTPSTFTTEKTLSPAIQLGTLPLRVVPYAVTSVTLGSGVARRARRSLEARRGGWGAGSRSLTSFELLEEAIQRGLKADRERTRPQRSAAQSRLPEGSTRCTFLRRLVFCWRRQLRVPTS